MATIFCAPKTLAVDSSVASASGSSPTNMFNDEPGMVWRSNGLSGLFVVVKTDGTAWDTIGLLSNLRASDTYRVRTAATAANTTSAPTYDSGTLAAWTGTPAAAGRGAMTLLTPPAARTDLYVRIDFTATSHPDAYLQVMKLVIGLKVSNAGVDIGAEQGVHDTSIVTEGEGYVTVTRYARKVTWKVTLSDIKAQDYYLNWWPFLVDVGMSKAFLFIPDTDPTYMQGEAVIGRMTGDAKIVSKSSDFFVVDLALISIN